MRRPWLLLGACIGSVALAAVAVARRRLLIVRVSGVSMEPVYHDGDVLLAARLSPGHGWRRSEDLVFSRAGLDAELVPGDPPFLVKRVCGVPGDPDPSQPDAVIPPDRLVLQGLNVTGPRPSYYSVPVELVLGKVVSRLPFHPDGRR